MLLDCGRQIVAEDTRFLPVFFYDDAAAKIRAADNHFFDPSVGTYRGG